MKNALLFSSWDSISLECLRYKPLNSLATWFDYNPCQQKGSTNTWSKSDSKFRETKLYALFFLDDESQRTFSNTFPLKHLDLHV